MPSFSRPFSSIWLLLWHYEFSIKCCDAAILPPFPFRILSVSSPLIKSTTSPYFFRAGIDISGLSHPKNSSTLRPITAVVIYSLLNFHLTSLSIDLVPWRIRKKTSNTTVLEEIDLGLLKLCKMVEAGVVVPARYSQVLLDFLQKMGRYKPRICLWSSMTLTSMLHLAKAALNMDKCSDHGLYATCLILFSFLWGSSRLAISALRYWTRSFLILSLSELSQYVYGALFFRL